MQIERLLTLVDGVLNEGAKEEAIYSATVYLAKVGEGSVFISSSQEEIEEAIKKGATAIIYDDETIMISNHSLAWIKVADIMQAAFKITQEVVSDEEASFYYFNEHELAFLKMIQKRKSDIEFLVSDWKKVFEAVLNSKKKIFIGTDLELMRLLRPKAKRLVKEVDGYIISDTLFRSTFKVEKYVYQHKELVPFHLEHILKVVAFCQSHGFEYAIENVRYIKKFIPLFIEGEPGINEQSKNDRTVIVCDNLEDIVEARLYILAPSAWVVKSIVLTPPKTKVDGVKRPTYYHTTEDILDTLKGSNFNYAFIYAKEGGIKEAIRQEYELY
jgi:ferrochelatase